MSITVYGIKACSTMKKAFTKLDEMGVSYQFHDYKNKGLISKAYSAGSTSWVLKKCLTSGGRLGVN